MNMWAAIFGIVAVSCIAGAVSSYFKSRGRDMGEKQRAELEGRLVKAERAAGDLEERVRILERIVTDGRHDLKREFDSLEG